MVQWSSFIVPESIEVESHTYSRYFGRFHAGPFERGYGTTIGNAFRRILLSSIEGAAVIAVRVNENLHEFASIPGVVEDVYEILLNLRHLVFKLHTDKEKRLYLRVDRKGPVYARDIEHDAEVEILDPDHYICTIGGDGYIELEMIARKGRGFVPAERNQSPRLPRGFIPVASLHNPVRKVNFRVEPTRVGERTDYEKLTLEVWTNGTVTPVEAVRQAAEILRMHAELFLHVTEPEVAVAPEATEEAAPEDLQARPLKHLGLSTRIVNILETHGISTVGALLEKSAEDLQKLDKIGKKTVEEIIARLQEHGLSLKTAEHEEKTPVGG